MDKEDKEKIIGLLTEIGDKMKEIKQILQEKRICDQCQMKITSEPYKRINTLDFCSQECWEK